MRRVIHILRTNLIMPFIQYVLQHIFIIIYWVVIWWQWVWHYCPYDKRDHMKFIKTQWGMNILPNTCILRITALTHFFVEVRRAAFKDAYNAWPMVRYNLVLVVYILSIIVYYTVSNAFELHSFHVRRWISVAEDILDLSFRLLDNVWIYYSTALLRWTLTKSPYKV
jgi:hypothetical protein